MHEPGGVTSVYGTRPDNAWTWVFAWAWKGAVKLTAIATKHSAAGQSENGLELVTFASRLAEVRTLS